MAVAASLLKLGTGALACCPAAADAVLRAARALCEVRGRRRWSARGVNNPGRDATRTPTSPYKGCPCGNNRQGGYVSVKSASERDREFSAFVSAQRAVLVRLAALLLTGDRATAEDVVQTALTRLYVTWPKVRPDTLNAYARRSVVNAVIDDRRKLFRRRERSQAELPDVTTVESRDVDQTAVIALLSTLPARMRAAVVLRYIEGLNAAETADALGCSEGTVRSQSARGLERLRAVFPEHAHNFA